MSELFASDNTVSIQPTMLRGTVAVVDMVGYSSIAKVLEQNFGAGAVTELNRQIQSFMTRSLAMLPQPGGHSMVAQTGDGIILLFDRPDEAHIFAWHVHRLAQEHNDQRAAAAAQRWFRIGIATGDISVTSLPNRPAEYAGTTIVNSKRLEASGHAGQIVIDRPSFERLSQEHRQLYGPERTVSGKREERFHVRQLRVTPGPRTRPFTRRAFIGTGITVLGGAAALVAWQQTPSFDRWRNPLPTKRFVALMGWPTANDPKIAPAITAVMSAIENELTRAETLDRNLLILPYRQSGNAASLDQVDNIRESLGANLVLAASAISMNNDLHLTLRIMGAPASQSLRHTVLRVPVDQLTLLPEKAVQAATLLLDIAGYVPDDRRSRPGTLSAEAYVAFQKAETLFDGENDAGLNEAIDQYKRAINFDNKYAAAHARLAIAYCRLAAAQHNSAAIAMASANASRALALDPSSVPAHVALASVCDLTGDEAGALDEMKQALALDPTNIQTLIWQSQIYTRLNLWTQAEQALKRVIDDHPNSWLAHNELGYPLALQGKYRDALHQFQLASLAAPRRSLALNNIGAIYLQLGDPAAAIANCRKSLDLKPSSIAAGTMAAALRVQGRVADARQFALQATQLDPEDATAWLELGDCLSLAPARKSDALAAYQTAQHAQSQQLETDPSDGPGTMLLALVTAKCAPSPTVFETIQKADTMHSADIDSQLYKARALEVIGRRADALATIQQCIARDSNHSQGATSFQIETMPDMQHLIADPRYGSIKAQLGPFS